MKLLLKNFTLRHYIRYMRRQSKHVQHIHAFVFAGTITTLIAVFILYTDYGFWHETYSASEPQAQESSFDPESPGMSLYHFWQETKARFSTIGSEGKGLLEGKETYQKSSE